MDDSVEFGLTSWQVLHVPYHSKSDRHEPLRCFKIFFS